MGSGKTVGNLLLEDRRIRGVSVTGSVATGCLAASACRQRHAKLQLEMGGKHPLVVRNDADLATTINCAFDSA